MQVLFGVGPRMSFRDVGRNRCCCPADLSSQSKEFRFRKALGCVVTELCQAHRLLPHNKFPIVLNAHTSLAPRPFSLVPTIAAQTRRSRLAPPAVVPSPARAVD